MKIVNTSTRIITIASGVINPGETGEATDLEAKFLLAQGKAKPAETKVKVKPTVK